MAEIKAGEEIEKIYRTEKFEVSFSDEEYKFILRISEILRDLYNYALEERTAVFTRSVLPIYDEIKASGGGANFKERLKEAYKLMPTIFSQINQLTGKRAADPEFAAVPRNWQEETLDMLDGAFKSFYSLRKNGDPDARPPRPRSDGFFQKIPGRYGFKVKDKQIVLSCSGRSLTFPIPDYQWKKLSNEKVRHKKFELYRDEPNLNKPGRFWISVAYELPAPDLLPLKPNEATYLALGASSIGVLSPSSGEVLPLWRPDRYWEPQIANIKTRMKKKVRGSRSWERFNSAKRKKEMISSRQRLQNEREIVDYLLEHYGCHFIVTELVVRSKEGKLADSKKPERRGKLGLNWSAQNTGSISRLVMILEQKAREKGGSVCKHRLVLEERPPSTGTEVKLWMAQKLKESFLRSDRSK